MRDHRIVGVCTLLGLLSGIAITWFVSVQSGTTFEIWMDELFINPIWGGWISITATAILPILTGLLTGLKKNSRAGVFLTPVFAILASAAALLLAGIGLLLMQYFEVVSFIGFITLIGLLMPVSVTIVVIVVSG